jgi:hypothetical protein
MSEFKRRIGELRPSQLLFTYGVGSIVDLPELSVLVMGLDDWPTRADVTREIVEERLLAAVRSWGHPHLSKFLAPPLGSTSGYAMDPLDEMALVGVPVATFPRWMVCPSCRLLAALDSTLFTLKTDRYRPNRAYYVHENCNKAKQPVAVPARFLVACEEGHLDDFPWIEYVHGLEPPCSQPLLRLFELGPSGEARDLVLRCESCQKERRLAEAFGRQNRQRLPMCTGRRPHLRDYDSQECQRHVLPIVLGASNAWFPSVLSSIAIPGTTVRVDQLVEEHWATVQAVTSPEVLAAFRRVGMLAPLAAYTDDEIWQAVQRKRDPAPDPQAGNPLDLRLPEWQVFSQHDPALNSGEFRLRPVAVPLAYTAVIDQVVLVERLREVQVLTGFTRIDSPGEGLELEPEDEIRTIAPLSRREPAWLPAVEVRGEGLFLQFSETAIRRWLAGPALQARDRAFQQAHMRWRSARYIENPGEHYPGMRYVLLHTFAHALMRQMAMEAGYSAASIRERIYSRNPDEPNGPMAGILIYTSASDSEGTLGGLVKQGEPEALARHMAAALEDAALCASDPTCAEHPPSDDGISLHAAACHACLFVPETSCERGNRYLDRSVLADTFGQNALAFFDQAG